jgi:AcrR family transcriptional regulator
MAPAPRTTDPPAPRGEERAGWGTISRQQIVDAALRAIRHGGGYEQMTIRSLAADIGVAPMSLYHHVRDKDDLLDEVVDRLLVRAWRPRADEADWKAWTAEAADKLRHFLVTQPAALHVYLRHPVVSPTAIARMEAVMRVLRRAVGDEEAARRAYAAIHTYTIGFAALEASRAGWDRSGPGGERTSHPDPDSSPGRGDSTGSDSQEMADQLAAYTTPRQFAAGVRYLLDGIDRAGRPHDSGFEDPGPNRRGAISNPTGRPGSAAPA